MDELLETVKRKSSKGNSKKLVREVEKDINLMQVKLSKLSRAEQGKTRFSESYLSEQYLESIKSGKDHLDGKEKINRIDEESYGPNWFKLTMEEREEKLMEYFDDLDETLFTDKDAATQEAISRLHDNKLRTAKEVKYDRVNKRVIKLMDMKFDMTTKRFCWIEKSKKKERPAWMKKMLKRK